MAKRSTRDKLNNEVNAGSMADIAFLLLIFFLVTTTIANDSGILVKLPIWSYEPPPPVKLNTRNVFSVLVNANNQLLVRGELMDIDKLRDEAKEFVANPNQRPDLAVKPTKAIISLKNDRGTKYETYVNVYNELKGAYNELREELAMRKFGKHFSDKELTQVQMREIKDTYPIILSEAEPTSFGEE